MELATTRLVTDTPIPAPNLVAVLSAIVLLTMAAVPASPKPTAPPEKPEVLPDIRQLVTLTLPI